MSKTSQSKRINLALQGGGAHGAFTWGALERLLLDERIEIVGITATSAGAMNAAALKCGWTLNGRQGALDSLEKFWLSIADVDWSSTNSLDDWMRMVTPSPVVLEKFMERHPKTLGTQMLTRMLSPYQFNPTAFHPLREPVEEMVKAGDLHSKSGPQIFVAATNVRSGKVRVFAGRDISTDAILASACLPTLFQAIEIDDPLTGKREAYWDGGYMGNPALFPLFYRTDCRDMLIVHINPIEREELPYTATEILNRINEISFNGSLLRELRVIDLVNRLKDDGLLPQDEMTENRVHSIRDDRLMSMLGVASKLTPNKALLAQLRKSGNFAMDTFLRNHFDDIGNRSTVDLRAMFGSASG